MAEIILRFSTLEQELNGIQLLFLHWVRHAAEQTLIRMEMQMVTLEQETLILTEIILQVIMELPQR